MKTLRLTAPGTVISESVRLKKDVYALPDLENRGAIVIRGSDLTLDFDGAELVGCEDGQTMDTYVGWGIVSDGNSHVTIKNARIRGFKTGIYATRGTRITLENCDLSGNYGMRLKSTPEAEDGADWLWPHHNDDNEWMTNYGANIYLEEASHVVVKECRGSGSQNGILLDDVTDSQIYDNDFSFNSGWGLAMWRSCRNIVSRNKFDWCVRGYSHGIYWRGQDSAGILAFEQCSDNQFTYNSATHGGDGFFLYAGNQTLRETGEGGCNRNLLYRNDFSHAVANGIEATFSEANDFIENRLDDCQHGIWGGYSYRTRILGNKIRGCSGIGIAIEHGSENVFEWNEFEGNPVGIRLWWDNNPDLMDGIYGQMRNTNSENNRIAYNTFRKERIAVHLRDTQTTAIQENAVVQCEETFRIEGDAHGVACQNNGLLIPVGAQIPTLSPEEIYGASDPFLPENVRRGRRHIVIGEWGPLNPETVEPV